MSDYDFKKQIEEALAYSAKILDDLQARFEQEQKEFDEAWDKRAKECAELERLFKL